MGGLVSRALDDANDLEHNPLLPSASDRLGLLRL